MGRGRWFPVLAACSLARYGRIPGVLSGRGAAIPQRCKRRLYHHAMSTGGRVAARRVAVAAIAVSALVAGIPLPAQQPTFRAGVEIVTLDVNVLDSDRRPVEGLSARDFRVTVDGRDVPVTTFSAISSGEREGQSHPAAGPDGTSEAAIERPGEQGRVLIVMFDRSIPSGEPTRRAREIARAVLTSAGSNDLVGVVRSSGFSNEGASAEPTLDRQSAMAAIDTPFTGIVSVPEMTFQGLVNKPPDLFASGDCLCGLCTFGALERVASALMTEQRQKLLFFIGSDIIIQPRPTDPQACQPHIREWRTRVLRALDRANVTVHSFDSLGLETLARNADAFPTASRGRAPMSRHLERQGNLSVLPDFTGGRAVLNTNSPESLVRNVLAETASYYVLGFERDKAASADQLRSVRVHVERRGVTVRSRTGYFAAPTVP